ncbi:DUF2065 domain-containing protein [Noviherbaspirillum galbum]|uniref:DUF2065 domain-containing protein n=1 Tax=Noviherbaspirillum galbum TaxID=2709383 RepID=A0A6B3SQ38_9BURK|nr:DUF2065 domain-containing protein [Noviherbaspirillum galbum]NEX62628.1 DUF2065 domain-containing protein [Noviherbaspirillum galbum]
MAAHWITALGLMLLLEGVVPMLFPRQWRDTMRRLTGFNDGQLRFIGLAAMLTGLAALALADLFS